MEAGEDFFLCISIFLRVIVLLFYEANSFTFPISLELTDRLPSLHHLLTFHHTPIFENTHIPSQTPTGVLMHTLIAPFISIYLCHRAGPRYSAVESVEGSPGTYYLFSILFCRSFPAVPRYCRTL